LKFIPYNLTTKLVTIIPKVVGKLHDKW
jgi:hypothetical protein